MGRPSRQKSTANAEVTLTIAALGADQAVHLETIGCCFDTTPAATAAFTLESPSGTVLQEWFITEKGPAPIGQPASGYEGAKGQAVVLRLAAGGGSAIGVINAVQRVH